MLMLPLWESLHVLDTVTLIIENNADRLSVGPQSCDSILLVEMTIVCK